MYREQDNSIGGTKGKTKGTHCVGPQRLNCWCWRWGEKSIPFDQKSNIGAWQQWQCCGGEGGSAETAAVLSMLFCCCGRCLVGRVLQTPEFRNSQCNRYNSAKSVKNRQKSFRSRKTEKRKHYLPGFWCNAPVVGVDRF